MDHIVFVYGTLRRGESNSHMLRGTDNKCLGPAVTAGSGYKMARHGTVPFTSDGGSHQVIGELWSVSDTTFARLDRLEGHPRLYRRRRRWFWTTVPGGAVRWRGWIYLCNGNGWGTTSVKPDRNGLLRCPTRLELEASGQF